MTEQWTLGTHWTTTGSWCHHEGQHRFPSECQIDMGVFPVVFDTRTYAEPKPTTSPRASILREAESLITGDRNKAYGSPTQNFTNTAEIWTTLLRHKLKDGEAISPAEVASFMIGLKLARTVGQPKRDNWVDMAGYAGCGYEAQVESEGSS